MKRRFYCLLAAMVCAAFFAAPLGAQELEKIVIGHSNIRNDTAAFWVPKELGIFRRNGLDPSVVLITGGVRMTQAILSGSAPFGMTGAVLVASAVAGGADNVMIAGVTNRLTYDVWARPEIKRGEDLRGKSIAISGFGSSSHVACFLMLQHFKLDEQKDHITFLVVGDEPTRAQALIAGGFDATIVDPSVSGPLRNKGFTYLGNLQDLGVPFVNNALISTRRYVKENPRTAEAVVRSLVEGNAFMLNPANKARVMSILAKNLRLDPKDAEKTYDDLLAKVERRPYPNMDAVKATIQVMGSRNPKIAQLKPDDLVDLSILQRLEKSGLMK
ncbi:MAG TPA: ABC transporter substrate-binding protein [Candidatus Binatia bacterium]|jgi:NitT/TauT family transport system substrate-binding protein